MRLAALRHSLRAIALFLVSSVSAFALIAFNDGHDTIFVTGSAGLSYDSNIFATADGAGDTSYNASLDLEYHRKAGMLGVDANLGWLFSEFDTFSEESFADPQFTASLTKAAGRTTGAVNVSAKRQNRAETAINLRTESWNYSAAANVRYPVIERYSLSGSLEYSRRDFANNDALVDIDTYAASADLLYALDSERNLMAGYRYRTTSTSVETTDLDHAFTVGLNGKILPKLIGTVRAGFQQRKIDRRNGPDESHNSLTASATTTWTLTNRFSLSGTASRDFVTVATDASVDTTSLGLDAQFALSAKKSVFAGISYYHLKFLDTTSSRRSDDGLGFNAGAAYVLNEHLKLSATYQYTINGSTLALSDFDRHSFSFNASSRW